MTTDEFKTKDCIRSNTASAEGALTTTKRMIRFACFWSINDKACREVCLLGLVRRAAMLMLCY